MCVLQIHSDDKDGNSYYTNLNVDLTAIDQTKNGCLDFTVHHSQEDTLFDVRVLPNTSSSYYSVRCSDANIMHVLAAHSSRSRFSRVVDLPAILWFFSACLTCAVASMAVMVCLSNALCFSLLANEPERFGEQRMWGSVGFGLCSLVSGYLVDQMSGGSALKDYSGVFYVMLVLMVCDFFVARRIRVS